MFICRSQGVLQAFVCDFYVRSTEGGMKEGGGGVQRGREEGKGREGGRERERGGGERERERDT